MPASPTQKLAFKLLFLAAGMFVFAVFVMPPLYDVFCEITGIGGKTRGQYQGPVAEADLQRTVKVQFLATNNAAMPWEFYPMEYQVKVHPGQKTSVAFYAKNATRRDMTAQAVPNITPINAAEFFHKTECFCFNQQPLAAGEDAEMPLVFIVDPDLPASVTTITLSYTLFDITDYDGDKVAKAD